MNPTENLYYAFGELAYLVAKADGTVHPEERKKFLDIINGELEAAGGPEKIGEIIFMLMEKKATLDENSIYDLAMQTIKTNSHYLSPELKHKAIKLLERVAAAKPPVTESEGSILSRFKEDISPLQGDPVYYQS